jgi:protoporphyrinogen oxidase
MTNSLHTKTYLPASGRLLDQKTIIILGAGISGLTIGSLLHEQGLHEVLVLEKDKKPGGIAKTKLVNNIVYHPVGGHCFNSKFEDVMSFIFAKLPKNQWHKIKRESKINLGKYEINYPIEFSIPEIYKQDKTLAFNIVKDLFAETRDNPANNLAEWFISAFGETLANEYFIPYNTKIWAHNLNEMSYQWVQDKLPVPNKKMIFESMMESQKDTMPHNEFYYPNTNNQQTLIEAIAEGLDIRLGYTVNKIEKHKSKWIINDEYKADVLISTIPLKELPLLIKDIPDSILKNADDLKYNKISNMLWKSKPTIKTWTYQPSKDSIFHRYIHIGNFYYPTENYTITETIGERNYETLAAEGKKDPFLLEPVDYNISDYAYVIFDSLRENAVNNINKYLTSIELYSVGRFAQWNYFNMDVCIKECFLLFNRLANVGKI